MNKPNVLVAFLAALLSTPVHAQKSSPAEILLESARQKNRRPYPRLIKAGALRRPWRPFTPTDTGLGSEKARSGS